MSEHRTEYFYTLDMGENFGPRLQRLAIMASCEDDIETFAAVLLCGAIEQLEASEERFLKELGDYDPNSLRSDRKIGEEIDDDIPF